MSILKNIKDFFLGMANKFIQIFKEFIAEALPLAKQIIIGQLKDLAVKAVTELQNTNLNDSQKRAEAFKRIEADAKAAGIDAKASLINLAIELAVQRIKF